MTASHYPGAHDEDEALVKLRLVSDQLVCSLDSPPPLFLYQFDPFLAAADFQDVMDMRHYPGWT